ncbi:MAG: endonuclease [Gammaproteobacteria bacterium HGW-Gammaproteobacteria-14]|nr:MAG: endonuclease [Gammaproteobacteria bacterium HGW-Gammaproteobacteria-14]
MSETPWWLYLLDCDGRLYTGISTDPQRRYQEHLSGGPKGARFTRAATQVSLLWSAEIGDRSLALRAEHRLRKLPRTRKLAVIEASLDGPAIKTLLSL